MLQWCAARRRGAPPHSSSNKPNPQKVALPGEATSPPIALSGHTAVQQPCMPTTRQRRPQHAHCGTPATSYRKCSTAFAFWARWLRRRGANVTDLRNVPIDPHGDSYYLGDMIPPPFSYLSSPYRTSFAPVYVYVQTYPDITATNKPPTTVTSTSLFNSHVYQHRVTNTTAAGWLQH